MIIIASGFAVGAWLLQQQATLPPTALLSITLIGALLVFSSVLHLFKQLKFSLFLRQLRFFVIAGFLGFMYAAIFAQMQLHDALPKAWERQEVTVVGVVASLPQVSSGRERFRFDVEQVLNPQARVPKHILLSFYHANAWQKVAANTPQVTTFKAGQRWQLTVRLKRPHSNYNPHGYDFEAWALAENIRAIGYIRQQHTMQKVTDFVWRPSYVVEHWRERIGARMTKALQGKPYAGVIRALVIGDHSQIRAQDWEQYLRTGTNHLMSISGLHITMLAGLVFAVVRFCWGRFPLLVLYLPTRKAAIIGGALVALLYACLAGLSVPTQRTLYMLATFAVALLLNRHVAMSRVLATALLVVVLLDPWAVIAQGFWLSFSAVAFITFAAVNRLTVRHWLLEGIRTQWSVTLGLLPLLIIMFGQASIVSPVANALAIPIISLFVVPFAIFGALLPVEWILQFAHHILAPCMQGLAMLADSPLAIWQQAAAPVWTFVFALLGVVLLLLPRGFPQRWLGVVLLLPMLLVQPETLAVGSMQVAVLDVGQGLSVVVKTAKHVMVYDTGPAYNKEKNAGLSVVAPYLRGQGIRAINQLVISHDDNDHSGGAASLIEKTSVHAIMSSYQLDAVSASVQQRCYAGQHWAWDGVRFEVLYPALAGYQQADVKDNNRSCVIKVTSHYGSLLLTGDIEKQAERTLLLHQAAHLKSDVMIAPHHGSQTSSTTDFVHAVDAAHIVFTVGYLNRFRHPKSFVVQRYMDTGAQLFRSDQDGAIIIDFAQSAPIQINTWRAQHAKYWHDTHIKN